METQTAEVSGVRQVISELLARNEAISSTEVAVRAGVSRQAAHKQLVAMVRRGALTSEGRARACRYRKVAVAQHLEVASAGSVYRLSARLLLEPATDGVVTLDFTGVVEVGDEFLEEVFMVWAPAHPASVLDVVNFPLNQVALLERMLRRAAA